MATQLEIYREALAFLGEARLATTTDDIPSRYALDDAYARAVDFVLRAAPWRHALKTAALATGGSPIAGYVISSIKPTDWLRTHAIFTLSGAREFPLDCKEQDTHVFSNVTPTMRYVCSGLAITVHPEQVAKTISAYLAFLTAERITGSKAKTDQMAELYQAQFSAALATDAIPENPWLTFQLDGSFYRHARTLLNDGFWRFCIKTVELDDTRGPEMLVSPQFVASTGWTLGTGWVVQSGVARHNNAIGILSQSVTLIDEVLYEVKMSVVAVTNGSVRARFSGTNDFALGEVRSAVGNYTESLVAVVGNNAFEIITTDPANLRIDNVSVKQALFPLSPSPGYGHAVARPTDFVRTFVYGVMQGGAICPIDYRDEGGALHSDYQQTVLRYVSSDGFTPTMWTDDFQAAVLACLQFEAFKANPKATGAVLQARALTYQAALRTARKNDDISERPKVFSSGKITAARLGSLSSPSREQGW